MIKATLEKIGPSTGASTPALRRADRFRQSSLTPVSRITPPQYS